MFDFKIFLILLSEDPLLTDDKCKEVTVALFQSNVLNESKVLRNTILVRFQFTKPLQGNWILFVFYHFEQFIDTRFRHKLLTYMSVSAYSLTKYYTGCALHRFPGPKK